jgi:hypothetical protein
LSPVEQALPSEQSLLLSMANWQPTPAAQLSSVQGLLSSQASAPLPVQTPLALQVSLGVQTLPSLHGLPVATLVYWQPTAVLQVSVVQALLSLQTTAVPWQTPAVQASVVVHKLPSLHADPLVTLVKTQPPEPQLSVVHGLPSLQAKAPLPTQPPEPLQVSVVVQTLPSLQTTPDATLLYWQPPVGLQVSVVQAWLSLHTTA